MITFIIIVGSMVAFFVVAHVLIKLVRNKTNKKEWCVWVGGVGDSYTDLIEAQQARNEWIADGYDDVILERIK